MLKTATLSELLAPAQRHLRQQADDLFTESAAIAARARQVERDCRELEVIITMCNEGRHPDAIRCFDELILRRRAE